MTDLCELGGLRNCHQPLGLATALLMSDVAVQGGGKTAYSIADVRYDEWSTSSTA